MTIVPKRTCLECKHLTVDGGCRGWSEYTPSSPFEMFCEKRHDVGYHNHDTTKRSLLDGLGRAMNCPDFEEETA